MLRATDKGVESETCSRDVASCWSVSRRWRKDREPAVDDVLARGLAEAFVGRELRTVVAGDDEVMVCDRRRRRRGGSASSTRMKRSRGDDLHRLRRGSLVRRRTCSCRGRPSTPRAAELRRLGLA